MRAERNSFPTSPRKSRSSPSPTTCNPSPIVSAIWRSRRNTPPRRVAIARRRVLNFVARRQRDTVLAYDPNNILARILRGELPKVAVYEDVLTLAFLDIMPSVEGHTLVIPKE